MTCLQRRQYVMCTRKCSLAMRGGTTCSGGCSGEPCAMGARPSVRPRSGGRHFPLLHYPCLHESQLRRWRRSQGGSNAAAWRLCCTDSCILTHTMPRPRADAKEGFFASLVDTVVQSFGGFYPELRAARDTIYAVIRDEEASFSRTLLKGIEKYKKAAAVAKEGEHLFWGRS